MDTSNALAQAKLAPLRHGVMARASGGPGACDAESLLMPMLDLSLSSCLKWFISRLGGESKSFCSPHEALVSISSTLVSRFNSRNSFKVEFTSIGHGIRSLTMFLIPDYHPRTKTPHSSIC